MRFQAQLAPLFDTATLILLHGLVGYRRAYGDVVPSMLLTFGAKGQQCLTAGAPVARYALVAESGLDWQGSASTTLSVAYAGQIGRDRAEVHGAKGSFTYRWLDEV